MPKVVVYVRAEDARVIQAREGVGIAEWVRSVVADEVDRWHRMQVVKKDPQEMPASWAKRKDELDQGA